MTQPSQNDLQLTVLQLAILILLRAQEGHGALSSDRLRDKLNDVFTTEIDGDMVREAKEPLRGRLLEYDRASNCLRDEGKEALAKIVKLIAGED